MTQETSYANYINYRLNEYVKTLKDGVFFGQNVVSGSRISGLGAKMEENRNLLSFNTQNSENTLFGLGFGLSIQGIPSIYLMKQHDFALLAMDHMVNTRRLLQSTSNRAPFLVLMVVVDSGFEGPQSNLNNLDDFFSLSNCKIWLLNSKEAIDAAFQSERQNFEIFAIAQSTLKTILSPVDNFGVEGGFSFERDSFVAQDSLPILLNCGLVTKGFQECVNSLKNDGFKFHVMKQVEMNLETNLNFISKISIKNRKIVIFDASKSINKLSSQIAISLMEKGSKVLQINRGDYANWSYVNHDQFEINYLPVLQFLKNV